MHQSMTCHSKSNWQTSHYSTIISQPSKLCLNFILQVFRLALWFYCLFRICFLFGLLLNKIHVVFDAFDSSCCSYVHKKFKKEKEEEKIFWTRVIRPSSHFNSFSKGNLWTRDIGLLGNFFLKIFCSFKDYNFFFFPFKSLLFKRIQKYPFDIAFSKSWWLIALPINLFQRRI